MDIFLDGILAVMGLLNKIINFHEIKTGGFLSFFKFLPSEVVLSLIKNNFKKSVAEIGGRLLDTENIQKSWQ